MIQLHQTPPIEPFPLRPGASPAERLEYQRQMGLYRAELREQAQQRDWDLAVHIVAGAILVLIAAAAIFGMIYYTAGLRGIAIAIAAGLAFWLAVVEVKRRL